MLLPSTQQLAALTSLLFRALRRLLLGGLHAARETQLVPLANVAHPLLVADPVALPRAHQPAHPVCAHNGGLRPRPPEQPLGLQQVQGGAQTWATQP